MDALDEQLAQLKLINSRSLSPKAAAPLPPGQNLKKVGPAVPPKPLKKNTPQVPQSSVVKQSCEPLYSKRLQADSIVSSSKQLTSGAPRKPQHVYSNMKLTLDNTVILDQQLEALEYHKKQLEKRAAATNCKMPSSYANGDDEGCRSADSRITPNFHVYSNMSPGTTKQQQQLSLSEPDVVYSNILHQSNECDAKDLVYSNVGFNNQSDELPPPPPLDIPAPLNLGESSFEYLQQTSEDELPPPPSPVSSSYSELRRATDNFPQMPAYPIQTIYNAAGQATNPLPSDVNIDDQQIYVNTAYRNDYNAYEPRSQGSSTYESIYEPINPRPPSQLSSRSNYSLYTSYVNGPQSGGTNTPSGAAPSSVVGGISVGLASNSSKLPSHKEAEVEALTNLLVHSMESGSDVDHYGICVKCGERVVGESSGCTAMEQIYHISCFTCSQCQINLQGKPFYALEGKPFCEEDYLNTLEKCSVCMKPILERILRATGKPFHPGCFCCVVCGNSLDGIPFTVDATNQNYCIEDFHKKFAPRCCVCRQPIMPEPGQEETVRVVALDRSFHFECYKCEDCGLLLSSEAEGRGCYPLDDHVLCKSCNAKRVQALTSRMTTEL